MEGGKPPRKNEASSADKADDAGKPPGPFDVRTVKALVSLMTQHDLSEIELRDGNQRLRLRRGAYQPVAPVGVVGAVPAVSAASPASPKTESPPAPPPPSARQFLEIKS